MSGSPSKTSLDWGNRSTSQKAAFIISVVVVLLAVVCLIANIVTCVKASNETWFTRCRDCKRGGGEKTCGKHCCADCTVYDAAIFYTLRIFSMLFCILAACAEAPALEMLRKLFTVFDFFWGRGVLQIFVGFLTLTGNLAPKNPDDAWIVSALGWLLIICGAVHLCLACCCFQEYSQMKELKNEESGNNGRQMDNMGPPGGAQQQRPPQQQGQQQGKYAV